MLIGTNLVFYTQKFPWTPALRTGASVNGRKLKPHVNVVLQSMYGGIPVRFQKRLKYIGTYWRYALVLRCHVDSDINPDRDFNLSKR
jgi:hypothetical protein